MKKGLIADIIRKVIICICMVIFLISAYELYKIFSEYNKNTNVYEEIKEVVPTIKTENYIAKEEFENLKLQNEDFKFWIRVPETEIDYPVVKGVDNDEYLYTNFKGESNKGGSIFLDASNNIEEDKNMVVYGHNMRDGSMFGTLRRLKNHEYFDKNNKIYIYLEDKTLEYEIFSVYTEDATLESYKTKFNNDEEYSNYINEALSKSFFSFDVKDIDKGKIITLTTCTNVTEEERLIVHGKLIDS